MDLICSEYRPILRKIRLLTACWSFLYVHFSRQSIITKMQYICYILYSLLNERTVYFRNIAHIRQKKHAKIDRQTDKQTDKERDKCLYI